MPALLQTDTELTVIADHRESRSGVVEALECLPGVTVRTATLEIGDYAVEGRLLVERKTVQDFAVSVLDTRLFRQAYRLAKSNSAALFLLEGDARDPAGFGLSREAFQGALITVTLIHGLPLLYAADAEESARLIVYAASQLHRQGTGFYTAHGRKPKAIERRKLYILQTLPGVGPRRAKRLLAAFGSVQGCVTASAEELTNVEGIGRETAGRIRRVLG